MDGPLIFIACLMTATLGILAALYSVARNTEPDRGVAPYFVNRVAQSSK
jgi:hypothetical protein